MKTSELSRQVEDKINDLAKHSLSMERDNMLLKRAVRIMAGGIHADERGEMKLGLTETQAQFIRKVVNDCNVFNTEGLTWKTNQ